MIRTVRFDGYDSWDDFGLIRTSTTISKPEAKTNTLEVEGMDGVIDFTEYFGEVYYKNRTITLEFNTKRPMDEFPKVYSDVCNALDGRRMRIALSEDPGYYWIGRVSVSEWKSNGRIGLITIEADCEPYKYKDEPTVRSFTVSGSKKVILENLRKKVSPDFDLGASMTIRFGGKDYSAEAGKWSDPSLMLDSGRNELTFTGTGSVTVTYQERGL